MQKNAIFSKTKQFRAMVSIDDLQEVTHTHTHTLLNSCNYYVIIKLCNWAFQRSLKSNMAEIRHLENRHNVMFFCRGWSDLDKISETGAK